jgi:cytochrome P450
MTERQSELDQSLFRSIDFQSDDFKANARQIVADWACRPPFYIQSEGFVEVVCGRYADVYEVFFDTKRFSSELPHGYGFEKFDKFMGIQTLPQTDGEPHARLKRLLTPAFSPRALSRLDTRITEVVDSILDGIERGGRHFDGMTDFGSLIIVGALLDAMLNLSDTQKSVFLALHEVLPLTTFTKPGEPYPPHCVAAFDRARAMVGDIIEQRRAHPGDDFISELIKARDQGDKLSDEELFNQIFTLCGAALSATSRAMGGALYSLYSHPDQLEILQCDPSLLPVGVEECLRFASSGYFTFPRIATTDTAVGGVPILKGMVVRPSPQAANLDPLIYKDPLKFDVRRDPKRILSFGFGHHHCLGNRLGRTAIVIALSRLIHRFPEARLADPDFVPAYGGAVGELRLINLPMMTH